MTMMPIGIPKVAYRMPGNRGGEWVDIFNRLTRERIIFMGSEIDDEMANQIIGVLLVHNIVYILCSFSPRLSILVFGQREP
jgi:ATP-dependent protease ClpP protease subunit